MVGGGFARMDELADGGWQLELTVGHIDGVQRTVLSIMEREAEDWLASWVESVGRPRTSATDFPDEGV